MSGQQAKFEAEVRVDLDVIERVVRHVLLDEDAQTTRVIEAVNRNAESLARAIYPHIKAAMALEGVTDNG